MKFSNGCWINKEGVGVFSPAEVYYTRKNDEEITICAPASKITTRGDTLGGIILTIKVSAPYPNTLRIRTYHHMGQLDRTPHFELAAESKGLMDFSENDEEIIIKNGSLSFHMKKDNGERYFMRDDCILTKSGAKDLAYVKTDWKGFAYDKGPDDAYMREQLSVDVEELIYGIGERFGAFVKNGQSIDMWNADGGTSTEQSYKNIPFYISNKGYGVFVNHPERVSYEVASEMVTKVGFSVEGEYLDYMLIDGPSMKEVLMHYTDITGKPALPAPWTFGLWLSTSFTTNYDENTVNSFVDGMRDRDIPLKTFHFDCFWMKEFSWCDFRWDPDVFPDPKGMLRRYHEKGLKICAWINPYIGQDSILFEEGKQGGYFIKRANGDVWQWDMWQPGMAIVDFTNPDAVKWYQGKLAELMDMGVDVFKTDFGERIPTDCVYFDGSDPKKMHNFYTYLYNKAVYEIIVEKKGKKDALLFARSATAGGQKFPVHWGGDCWSDYVSMEESLRGGLSFTSSGFGFWAHDIGGFESTSTADVYKRWCAFGAFSSHTRLHGSSSYRVPWNYDEEACDVLRYFIRLKLTLMPYIYRNAIETSQTGVPFMRSMALEYTSDKNCAYLATQYFFGDSILVAPVFNEESIAEYYLPEGTWTHLMSGEVKTGGKWYKEKIGYCDIPAYVREGSIIPIGAVDDDPEYDYADGVTYRIYALTDGLKETGSIEALRDGDTVSVSVKAGKPAKIMLVNTAEVSKVEGAEYEKTDAGILISVDADVNIKVSF